MGPGKPSAAWVSTAQLGAAQHSVSPHLDALHHCVADGPLLGGVEGGLQPGVQQRLLGGGPLGVVLQAVRGAKRGVFVVSAGWGVTCGAAVPVLW